MIEVDVTWCDQCGSCVGVCAAEALFIEDDALCFERDKCTLCRNCIKVCPAGALREKS